MTSTLAYPLGSEFDPGRVRLGPGLTDETLSRLVGGGEGRRVLELGCGDGSNAIALAKQGARVIVVDSSAARLGVARNHAEEHDVRIEFHHGDLADLAFVRADQIDVCLAVYSLAEVGDVSRVFRQVHRVLKPEAPLVCSFPHPAFAMFDPTAPDPLRVAHPYDQSGPRSWELGNDTITDHPRTVGEIFTTLHRSSFVVDQLLEPTAPERAPRSASFTDAARFVPATLIVRARKQGN